MRSVFWLIPHLPDKSEIQYESNVEHSEQWGFRDEETHLTLYITLPEIAILLTIYGHPWRYLLPEKEKFSDISQKKGYLTKWHIPSMNTWRLKGNKSANMMLIKTKGLHKTQIKCPLCLRRSLSWLAAWKMKKIPQIGSNFCPRSQGRTEDTVFGLYYWHNRHLL